MPDRPQIVDGPTRDGEFWISLDMIGDALYGVYIEIFGVRYRVIGWDKERDALITRKILDPA